MRNNVINTTKKKEGSEDHREKRGKNKRQRGKMRKMRNNVINATKKITKK